MSPVAVRLERLLRETVVAARVEGSEPSQFRADPRANSSYFGPTEAHALLKSGFAPWVQDLGLIVEGCAPAGARLRLPHNSRLLRLGNAVSGQVLMACADTAMAIAIMGAAGKFTNATTLNQSIDFMRPIADADVIVLASVRKAGRSLIFTQANFTSPNCGTLSAQATATWARIP